MLLLYYSLVQFSLIIRLLILLPKPLEVESGKKRVSGCGVFCCCLGLNHDNAKVSEMEQEEDMWLGNCTKSKKSRSDHWLALRAVGTWKYLQHI